MKRFRSPQTVIARFVALRSFRGAALWALAFGAMVTSKSLGFVSAYPTYEERVKLAATFSNNIGLNALLGLPHQITTIKGFAVWNALGIIAIIGAIWGFLLATRSFRGEEDSGRWEVLLTGQTTARGATINTLLGLGASLVVLFTVTAAIFIGVGQMEKVGFEPAAAAFFALAAVAAAAEFMAVGALASQIMPVRTRAAALCAGIFGVSFLLRVVADVTSAHWVLNLTPLGWIERLHPMYDSQPIWLVPIGLFTALCAGAAIWLAGRRDLGASLVADKDSAEPHTGLLGGPFLVSLRLTRASNLAWLIGLGLFAGFFGLLAKSAAQAFEQSVSAQELISKLSNTSQHFGAATFLGILFFLLMTLLMSYTASAVGAMREDEAEGYLDNMLVRSVSRLRWLVGRILIITGVIVSSGLLAATTTWLSQASQHLGLSYHSLLEAGINAMAPAIFILGLAVFVMGVLPRMTTIAAFTVIAWSFLLQMLSSGINLNHWLLDTSLLHHMALAPAASVNWGLDASLLGLGLLMLCLGAYAFSRRDIQTA